MMTDKKYYSKVFKQINYCTEDKHILKKNHWRCNEKKPLEMQLAKYVCKHEVNTRLLNIIDGKTSLLLS